MTAFAAPSLDELKRKYLQTAGNLPGAADEINRIASGELPGYQAQHPTAKAFATEAARYGHKPVQSNIQTPPTAMIGSQQVPYEVAQQNLVDSQQAQTQASFGLPSSQAPVNNTTYQPAHQQSFAQQLIQRQHQNIQPIRTDIPTDMILSDSERSFTAIQARTHAKFGDVVQTPDGSFYQMGRHTLMPAVFDEHAGKWTQRDEFIRGVAGIDPQVSSRWNQLNDFAQKINDDSRYTHDQQVELKAQLEREKNKLARTAQANAIPQTTPQQEYENPDSQYYLRAKDGSVWYVGPDGKHTKVDAAHHERQQEQLVPGTDVPQTKMLDAHALYEKAKKEIDKKYTDDISGKTPEQIAAIDKPSDEKIRERAAEIAHRIRRLNSGPPQEADPNAPPSAQGIVSKLNPDTDLAAYKPPAKGANINEHDLREILRYFKGDKDATRKWATENGWVIPSA